MIYGKHGQRFRGWHLGIKPVGRDDDDPKQHDFREHRRLRRRRNLCGRPPGARRRSKTARFPGTLPATTAAESRRGPTAAARRSCGARFPGTSPPTTAAASRRGRYGGSTTIQNSTVSGNAAYNSGGGILAWTFGYPYGSGTTTVQNSTITGNTCRRRLQRQRHGGRSVLLVWDGRGREHDHCRQYRQFGHGAGRYWRPLTYPRVWWGTIRARA